MKTRTLLVCATAAVLCGVLVASAFAGSARGSSLNLTVDNQHAVRTFVDAAPLQTRKDPNDSPGDTIVLHAPLLNSAGKKVGMLDATFLTTAVGVSAKQDGSEQLTGTLTFTDGSEIAVQGVVGAFNRASHVAVVGGTGRYAGAHGQVTAMFSPRSVQLHVAL